MSREYFMHELLLATLGAQDRFLTCGGFPVPDLNITKPGGLTAPEMLALALGARLQDCGIATLGAHPPLSPMPNSRQQFLHALQQDRGTDGLDEVIVGARLKPNQPSDLAPDCGEKQDRYWSCGRMPPENLANGKAIEVWQQHVQEDTVWQILAHSLESLESTGSSPYRKACGGEMDFE